MVADLDNVKAIQAKYQAKPLSAFLGTPAPAAAAAVNWPKIDKSLEQKDPFGYLAFLLQFAPATGPAAVEIPLRQSLAQIGREAGKPFPTAALSEADKAAMFAAMEPAKAVASGAPI